MLLSGPWVMKHSHSRAMVQAAEKHDTKSNNIVCVLLLTDAQMKTCVGMPPIVGSDRAVRLGLYRAGCLYVYA